MVLSPITLNIMSEKINVFLDFDDTITLSSKQFVKVANKKFRRNENWENVKLWSFKDLYPNLTEKETEEIFYSKDFFVDLEPQKDVIDTIVKLKDKINLHIATIGFNDNLNNKKEWLKSNLNDIPFEFHGVLINNVLDKYDKSKIDMSNSIFIDDRIDNLRMSNAKIKILYKNYNDYSWNQIEHNDEVYVTNTWKEIYEILDFFVKHKEMI